MFTVQRIKKVSKRKTKDNSELLEEMRLFLKIFWNLYKCRDKLNPALS